MEYCYSRCWKPWTRSSIGTLFWQRLNHGAGTYKKRRVCVTIKKYSVNKPPYIQIRLFTAKENEVLKQVAYVNYTLNEFKELAHVLGDFMFVDNCNVQ